ncbi:MAG: 30S ribosomal protein S14 [Gammaproteobacteria bacterium]|nr:30S ribosomal protein S14 [Gammaproteobacteria bacterium]
MAKTSTVQRELKKERLVAKFAVQRAALKETIRSPQSTDEEKWEAQAKLQSLPRSSSKTRLRNRCHLTGRPHGVYRKFGLARTKLREAAMVGDLPGLTKASW